MSPEKLKEAGLKAQKFLRGGAVDILAVEGQKHFKGSFERGVEGFTDKTLKKWPDIQEKTKKRKRRKNGSLPPILTDKGHLADSIRYDQDYNQQAVKFSSNLEYAQVHNEGGGPRNMPKRQYMGESEVLDDKVTAMIDKQLDKFFS